ncbi:hypothetical protein DER44DRAFT_669699, partial [Fusarium oxysporum]
TPSACLTVLGSYNKTIGIWNAVTGECKQILEGHSKEVCLVVFLHNLKQVVSASRDITVQI